MIGGWRRVGTRAWRVPLLCGVGMVILQTGLTIYRFGETTSLREWVNPLLWGGLGLFFVTGGKAPSPACLKRPFTTQADRLRPRLKADGSQLQRDALLGEPLWVVHAFLKKAKQGIKTPTKEIDLIRERLKRLRGEGCSRRAWTYSVRPPPAGTNR